MELRCSHAVFITILATFALFSLASARQPAVLLPDNDEGGSGLEFETAAPEAEVVESVIEEEASADVSVAHSRPKHKAGGYTPPLPGPPPQPANYGGAKPRFPFADDDEGKEEAYGTQKGSYEDSYGYSSELEPDQPSYDAVSSKKKHGGSNKDVDVRHATKHASKHANDDESDSEDSSKPYKASKGSKYKVNGKYASKHSGDRRDGAEYVAPAPTRTPNPTPVPVPTPGYYPPTPEPAPAYYGGEDIEEEDGGDNNQDEDAAAGKHVKGHHSNKAHRGGKAIKTIAADAPYGATSDADAEAEAKQAIKAAKQELKELKAVQKANQRAAKQQQAAQAKAAKQAARQAHAAEEQEERDDAASTMDAASEGSGHDAHHNHKHSKHGKHEPDTEHKPVPQPPSEVCDALVAAGTFVWSDLAAQCASAGFATGVGHSPYFPALRGPRDSSAGTGDLSTQTCGVSTPAFLLPTNTATTDTCKGFYGTTDPDPTSCPTDQALLVGPVSEGTSYYTTYTAAHHHKHKTDNHHHHKGAPSAPPAPEARKYVIHVVNRVAEIFVAYANGTLIPGELGVTRVALASMMAATGCANVAQLVPGEPSGFYDLQAGRYVIVWLATAPGFDTTPLLFVAVSAGADPTGAWVVKALRIKPAAGVFACPVPGLTSSDAEPFTATAPQVTYNADGVFVSLGLVCSGTAPVPPSPPPPAYEGKHGGDKHHSGPTLDGSAGKHGSGKHAHGGSAGKHHHNSHSGGGGGAGSVEGHLAHSNKHSAGKGATGLYGSAGGSGARSAAAGQATYVFRAAIFAYSKTALYSSGAGGDNSAGGSFQAVYGALFIVDRAWYRSVPPASAALLPEALNNLPAPVRPQSLEDVFNGPFFVVKVDDAHISIGAFIHVHRLAAMASVAAAPRLVANVVSRTLDFGNCGAYEGLNGMPQPDTSVMLFAGDVGMVGRTEAVRSYGAVLYQGAIYLTTSEFFSCRGGRLPAIFWAVVDPGSGSALLACGSVSVAAGVIASRDGLALGFPVIAAREDAAGAVVAYSYAGAGVLTGSGVAYAGVATTTVSAHHGMADASIDVVKLGEGAITVRASGRSSFARWGGNSACDVADGNMWFAVPTTRLVGGADPLVHAKHGTWVSNRCLH